MRSENKNWTRPLGQPNHIGVQAIGPEGRAFLLKFLTSFNSQKVKKFMILDPSKVYDQMSSTYSPFISKFYILDLTIALKGCLSEVKTKSQTQVETTIKRID